MEHITISQIKILDAVAKNKNFSKAAEYLGISQPAVSLQLRELQKRYGVLIFYRKGREVRLSDLGQELLSTGRKILGLLSEMDACLKGSRDLMSGNIHIGLSCHYFVKGLLASFMARYPEIHVKATIGHSSSLVEEVLACRMDIAEITALRPDPRLHHLKYSEQEIFLFVSKDHPWAFRKQIHIKKLHNEKMVALHTKSMTRQVFDEKLSPFGIRPDIALELDSWETMKDSVIAGIGFGIALEDEFGPDDRMVKIALKGADFKAFQYIVCLPEYQDLKLISAFLDVAHNESIKNRLFKQSQNEEGN